MHCYNKLYMSNTEINEKLNTRTHDLRELKIQIEKNHKLETNNIITSKCEE